MFKKAKYLLLALLLLASCGHKVKEGICVDKCFVPTHTWTHYMRTGQVTIPMVTTIPDAWYVTIDSCGITSEYQVNKEQYTKISVGERVKFE